MSIRSVTDLAVERDMANPSTPVPSISPGRAHERARDAVISAIPSEVLVLYTAVTGGTLALLIRDHPDSYLPYRWTLFAVVLLLTPLAIYAAYRRKFKERKKEPIKSNLLADKARVPYLEMTAATLAAAAWFLAAPGSPLLAMLSASVAEMTSLTIVVAATAVLWVGFGRPLSIGSNLSVTTPDHVPTETNPAGTAKGNE
jgi:hypothetical protein